MEKGRLQKIGCDCQKRLNLFLIRLNSKKEARSDFFSIPDGYAPICAAKDLIMKKFVMFAIIASFTLVGCKKDKDTVSQQDTERKLVQYDYAYSNQEPVLTEMTYNESGRIATIKSESGTEHFDFQSSSKLIITRRLPSDNSVGGIMECTRNAQGYITHIDMRDAAGNLLTTIDYAYDQDGYMVKYRTVGFGNVNTTDYVVKEGNLLSAKEYHGGELTYTYTFIHSSVTNTLPGSYFGLFRVERLFGRSFKNTTSEMKQYKADGSLYAHIQNLFQVDAIGYIVKEIRKFPIEGKTGVLNYKMQ